MDLQGMNLQQALEAVDQVRDEIQQKVEESDDPNEKIANIIAKNEKLLDGQKDMENTLQQMGSSVESLERFDQNDSKKTRKHIKKRRDEIMEDYEGGAKPKHIIFCNIQGMLFHKHNVNKYEELYKVNYASIQDDIDNWVPTGKVKEKLEPYKINYKQTDIFDELGE